jgi:hypothetical protein
MASQLITESVQDGFLIRLLRPALTPFPREVRHRRGLAAAALGLCILVAIGVLARETLADAQGDVAFLSIVGLATLCASGAAVCVVYGRYRSKPQFLATAEDARSEEVVLLDWRRLRLFWRERILVLEHLNSGKREVYHLEEIKGVRLLGRDRVDVPEGDLPEATVGWRGGTISSGAGSARWAWVDKDVVIDSVRGTPTVIAEGDLFPATVKSELIRLLEQARGMFST